jgi:copper(I)-binding protein
MRALRFSVAGLLLAGLCPLSAFAAGQLVVEQAWIRAAPPAVPMRAGYAVLRNAGDAVLTVKAVSSASFGDVSIHTTLMENGVARMRELPQITLAPGERIELEPGGKHLMLMQPAAELATGAKAELRFEMQDGTSTAAEFVVREADGDPHAHH